MKLVIVESPAKCTTIKKYIGDDYVVVASKGHIRDLSTKGKGGLGIDVENNFAPSYVISKDKISTVNELIELAKKADEVLLGSDPDREGEAIAWHLAQVLNLDVKTTKRLDFHEITRDSIVHAIQNPRVIDLNLVSSQETRRIFDRIIGFRLSGLMYRKIKSRSAGRVQSAVLKLIADHDIEVDKFVPEEYWNLNTKTTLGSVECALTFTGKNGKAIEIKNEEQANKILSEIPDDLRVSSVKKSIRLKESSEPFKTSTLQQEAFAKLKYDTKKTMRIAQTLYEGIDIGDEHRGLITYMRTDSTRISNAYIERALNFIKEEYGEEYVGTKTWIKKVQQVIKKGTFQDGHEGIRPTSNHLTPDSIKKYLTDEQYNLYKLIYNRVVGALMSPKKEEVLTLILEGNGYSFKHEFTHTIFKGYEAVWDGPNWKKPDSDLLPDIKEGSSIVLTEKNVEQKFTQAPARYSEAKIVKIMEEEGIGRPSTYASTIQTLKARKYVESKKGVIISTEQGKKTAHVLEKYFPNIVDAQYTAQMEEKLDNVEDGSETRVQMLSDFYYPFVEEIKKANEIIYVDPLELSGEKCPICGSDLVYKEGKNGRFIGCSNYPKCKYVKKEAKEPAKETGELCPLCGKPLVIRKDRRGKEFVACSGYAGKNGCNYVKKDESKGTSQEKTGKTCPKCGAELVRKKGRYGYFLGCSNHPNCDYIYKFKRRKTK